MSTNTKHQIIEIDTDRRAFVIVGLLGIIWIILYNNLQPIADWITYTLLQLSHESRLGESLNFFIYDVGLPPIFWSKSYYIDCLLP